MAKQLKVWNGGDWGHRGGHLYVCAHSAKEAAELLSRAYRTQHPDTRADYDAYAAWHMKDFSPCWGNHMNGIVPEMGVWWCRPVANGWHADKPERLV